MLRIRLTRVGKKNSPAYRVVVAEQKKAVQRKFIEILGHYNPASNPKEIVINKEKALDWISKGAQPSDTVNNLMCRLGILPKSKQRKIVYGKATKKKDAGKKSEEPVKEVAEEATTEEVAAENQPAEEVSDTPAEPIETVEESVKPEETEKAEPTPESTEEAKE